MTTPVDSGIPILPGYAWAANGLALTFTDESSPTPVSWLWDFGDGTTSTVQNPTYTYGQASTFTVVLTVTNANGSSYSVSGNIVVATSGVTNGSVSGNTFAPEPAFTAAIDYLAVAFTDTSTTSFPPITAWLWDFGDDWTSGVQNPTHTYHLPGTYTVLLTASDSYSGTQSAMVSYPITVTQAPAVTAAFNFTTADLQVTFTDQSITSAPGGTIDTWHWDFGDGQVSSAQNPVHTYSSAGSYTVTLTAGDSASNVNQVSQSVAVATPSFSYVINGLSVTFTDTSTTLNPPITSWLWDFGDGATSNSQGVSHTYAAAGTYTVSLTTTDASGPQLPVTQAVTLAAVAPAPTPTPTPPPVVAPLATVTPGPTYVLKGFVGYSALANNTPGVTSTLGELSTDSRTFAQDIQVYGGSTGGATPSSVDMSVFSTTNSDGTAAVVPSDYASTLLTIAAWLYNQALLGSFTADANVFIQALTSQYGTVINTITIDQMLSQGGIWLPGELQFYFTNASTVSPSNTGLSRIKLWFSDQAFRSEYDLYTIAVVSPVTNLDDFFNAATQVQTSVNVLTLPQLMANIATARNSWPETILSSQIFDWMDPVTVGNFIPTNWTYLIWGAAGNNIDAIKQALQAYILANSSHTQAEWAAIFPDIFTSTEFIITPLWTQYAIPNQTLVQGMYAATVNPNQALTMAVETAVGSTYTPQYIANHINIVPTAYKAMAMAVVGNPQNEGGITEFTVRWPDYLDVPTTSSDYQRMGQDTQAFVSLLYKLLAAAETMTDTSDLPVDVTRLTRVNSATGDTVMYAVAAYNNVDYLVVTKAFLVGKYGATTNTTASAGISYNGTFNNGAYQLLSSTSTMTLQFVPENTVAPLTWTILDTTMSSASIDTTGLLTATFPSVGLYTVTLQLTDAQAHSVTQTLTFNYQQPTTGGSSALAFGTQTLPMGTVGTAYNGTILISGGTVPYAITNQSLPPGLTATISGTEVLISGTPTQASGTQAGTTSVIGIVDSTSGTPQATSLQFAISIAAQGSSTVAVGAPTNLSLTIGTQYTGSSAITGGVSPYTLVSDTLPAGLSAAIVNNTVAISGTPTTQTTGSFAASITVADSQNVQGTGTFTFTVN